ncbi:hypothetical protein J7E83_11080 [Arthrobacter sp. ISL-48]|uniref:SRPBCC family protein n=1 Tax=Arthrobacter sp. ISL-48 TaxID=2819110 RepID=UPI001BE8F3D2|nr:hypothetical protein [Arthrobacter sp. ISL-48]MBT2532654.1 hypothetical protein [Arthrobacter sp. ISL-48]
MLQLAQGHATSTASPADFYARWIQHDTWASWPPDTDWVRAEHPVEVGSRGTMKPKGGPKLNFIVTTLEPDREYTDTTRLPGARLVFQHTARATEGQTVLGVSVGISGPLAFIWAKILGEGFRDSAQADLDRLVRIVEEL